MKLKLMANFWLNYGQNILTIFVLNFSLESRRLQFNNHLKFVKVVAPLQNNIKVQLVAESQEN